MFHALNRANAGLTLFESDGDYAAFEQVLEQARARTGIRLLAYALMPNHWHLVLWPETDDQVSAFMGWLTLTHTQRWHVAHRSVGAGHVYQGRFKSVPVQDDNHLLRLCRYVERNALRAGLCERAEDWRWSSLWRRTNGDTAAQALLSGWPTDCPANWPEWVNEPQSEAELEALRGCVLRGRPYGDDGWAAKAAASLGLSSTLRSPGRPRKGANAS